MLTVEHLEALATVHLHPQTQAGGEVDLMPLLRAVEAASRADERERCIAECRAVAAEHLGQRGMYQAGREHGADECVRRLEGPNAELTGDPLAGRPVE